MRNTIGGWVHKRQDQEIRALLAPKGWLRTVKLSKEKLENEFVALLQKLRPSPEIISEFSKIAAQVWAHTQIDTKKNFKKLSANLEEQKQLKAELLEPTFGARSLRRTIKMRTASSGRRLRKSNQTYGRLSPPRPRPKRSSASLNFS